MTRICKEKEPIRQSRYIAYLSPKDNKEEGGEYCTFNKTLDEWSTLNLSLQEYGMGREKIQVLVQVRSV